MIHALIFIAKLLEVVITTRALYAFLEEISLPERLEEKAGVFEKRGKSGWRTSTGKYGT
jgi:hypothetical protein